MKGISFLCAALLLAAGVAGAQQKKRVAIMNFDYSTVRSGVQAIWNADVDIGKGIADLLVDKLVQDGTYSVVERKALDKILAEQNFSNSDRADSNSAAKIGKVLGVDAIIIGSITEFGRDDKKTDVGGGALGGVTGRFGIGGISKKNSKAVVAITARMISTDTAEILASATGKGESSRSGTGLLSNGGSTSTAIGGIVDMKASNFANSILGEAVKASVDAAATQLESKAGALPVKTVSIEGLVADAAPDGTLVINVGSSNGVKVGDKLQVKRATRKITDPATGKVIRQIEESVGQLTITEVDASSAVGKFSGAGKPQTGDTVKSQ
jgi:curli biogenesis system outer membrane secretion channel CsgG